MIVSDLLLGFSHGNLPELFEVLHEGESSLAGACASGLVTLLNLSISVHDEVVDLFLDFCNELFHFF